MTSMRSLNLDWRFHLCRPFSVLPNNFDPRAAFRWGMVLLTDRCFWISASMRLLPLCNSRVHQFTKIRLILKMGSSRARLLIHFCISHSLLNLHGVVSMVLLRNMRPRESFLPCLHCCRLPPCRRSRTLCIGLHAPPC